MGGGIGLAATRLLGRRIVLVVRHGAVLLRARRPLRNAKEPEDLSKGAAPFLGQALSTEPRRMPSAGVPSSLAQALKRDATVIALEALLVR